MIKTTPQSPLFRFLLSEERSSKRGTHYSFKGGRRLGALLAVAILAVAFSATIAASSSARRSLFDLAFGKSSTGSGASSKTGANPNSASANSAMTLAPLDGAGLNIERRGHTATLLTDGKVLVAGGQNANGFVATAEIFDSASGFSTSGNLSSPRADHTATLLSDGRVLIAGGHADTGALNSTEIFDPTTGVFTSGQAMSVARAGHSATLFADGRILIAGGDADGSAELLDLSSGGSTSVGSLNAARSMHSAALLQDGRVFVVGGRDADGNALSSGEIFDPADSSFSAIDGGLTVARVLPHLRVLFDGKIQVIGGSDDGSMEIYDPQIHAFGAYAHVAPEGDTCAGLPAQVQGSQTRAALFHNGQSDETFDRTRHTMSDLATQAVVIGGVNSGGSVLSSTPIFSSSAAAISTDKLDYAPGQTVYITGRGFQSGEIIRLKIHEDPHTPLERGMDVNADADGNFVAEYLVQDYDLFMKFLVGARGLTSGRTAQTTFTDAAFTAAASGLWNNPTTWGFAAGVPVPGTNIPGASDTVTIASNRTVTVNISNAACLSVQLAGGGNTGSLSFASGSQLTVGGNIVVGAPGSGNVGNINMVSGGTLKIGGLFSIPSGGGTFNGGTGTVEYTSNGSQSIFNFTYNNLILSGTGGGAVKTLAGGNVVNGTLTVNSTLQSGGSTLTGTGSIVVNSGGIVNWNSTNPPGITGTKTFNSGSTFNYNMGAVQNVGAFTYANLTTGGSGAKTLLGPISVTGNLTIGQLMAAGANNIQIAGNWSQFSAFTFTGSQKVTLNGTGTQTILGGTFNNLEVNKSSGGVSLSTPASVQATLTLTNGIITTGGATITIGSAGAATTGSPTSHVDGKLARVYNAIGSKNFPIGKSGNFRPVTLNYTALTGTSTVTAEQFETGFPGTAPGGTTPLGARYWNVTQTGGSGLTYNITLDGTGNSPTGAVKILKYDNPNTVAFATSAPDYTATGLTSMSDFTLAEDSCTAASVTLQPTNQIATYGDPSVSFTSTASGTPTPSVQWQVNTGSGFGNLANGGNVSGADTTTLTISNPTVAMSSYQYRAVFTNTCSTVNSNAATLTVNKATPTATLAVNNSPQTYDGSPKAATVAISVSSVPGSVTNILTGGAATQTNAGTYPVTADFVPTDTANYNSLPGLSAGNFVISKATATISVTGFSGVYDGAAHGVVSSSATGVNSEALTGLSIDPATFTNVPGGTIPWTFTNSNYADQNGNATVTINKAATVTTVSCGPGPFTYNGAAQTPCSASVTGPNSLNESLTVNYSDNTNAGTAGASASYAETANYLGSSDSENFTIGKATATITVTGFSGDYDGAAHGVVSSSALGVNSEALSGLVIDPATYTNVPGGTIPWTFTNPNYADQNGNATVTINKAATVTTVSCGAGPFTYNGAAQTPCSASVTGPNSLNESLTVNYSDNTNAGTAGASASYAETANYLGSSDSENFSIGKATATITVTGFSGDYDGAAHGVVSSSALGVNSEALSGLVIDPATYANVPGGTIPWTFTNPNYADQNGNATVTINKAATITTVTCGPGPFTYNGAAQTPCSASVTGPNSLNESLTVNYSDNTNAGTAGASASYAETANYLGSSDSENFSIGKATATITVTGFSGDYDGAAHGVVSSSAVGVNSEALSGLVIDPATYTNVPGGSIPWTFTNPNYADQNGNATVTINKAATVTTVSCGPGPFTYNGAAQTPCSASVTGPNSLNESLTVNYSDNTNAGTAGASASYAETANYLGSSDSENFSIGKATATITVTGFSGDYDGAAHGVVSSSAVGVNSEALSGLVIDPATYTNVPGGTIPWTFTNANYADQNGNATVTINKAATVTTVSCGAGPFTYNGAAQTPCSASVTGPNSLNESLTVNYSDNINAGTAGASASYAETANYLGSSDSENFTIGKATATISVVGFSGVYDGAAHGVVSSSATGVNSEALTGLSIDPATFTNVPGGSIPWTFTNANYSDDSGSATVTITKATAVISVVGFSGVYDGAAHGVVSSSATGVNSEALTGLSIDPATFTNVPGGSIPWTFTNPNYADQNGSATVTINKATATITVTGFSGVYDGNPHGVVSSSATGVNSEALTGLSIDPATFTNVPGGSIPWTFTNDNYGDQNGSATVTITKATAVISVIGFSGVYDGAAHGVVSSSATGVNSEALTGLSIDPATFTNVPGGSIPWTFTNANYSDDSGSATVTITKATATISVVGFSGDYDGAAHGVVSSSAVGVNSEALSGLVIDPATYTNVPGGTIPWTFTNPNYADQNGNATVTINKAATVTTVSCGPGPFTYNGAAQTPCSASVTGPNSLNESLTVNYSDNTNAGTAGASASYAETANYLGSSDSENFTIGKATATISVVGFSGVYDGAAHGVVSSSATGVNSEALSGLVIDPATYTNVPGGTIPWTFTNPNYADQNGNATVTITKAATVTTVTCGAGPFTYNGAAQTPCSASVTGPNSLNESLTVNYSDNTNAGTAGASASYAETANYLGSSDSENFSIGKATATITVTGFSGDYDGAAHGVVSSSALGVNSEALSGLVIDPATYTNVPGGTIPWTFTNPNYADQNGNATVTINKAATVTTVSCGPGPFTYNGAAQTPCSASVTGPNSLNESLTVNYSDNTNAGTAGASASYAETANYLGSSDSENFSIGKATATITVTGFSGDYDGAAHGVVSSSAVGVNSEALSGLVIDPATYTNVPGGTIPWTFTNANYADQNGNATVTINKAATVTTVSCGPGPFTYNGAAQTPCSASVTGPNSLNESLTVNYSDNTNAGTAGASASYAETANYLGSSDSENFSIGKATATITVTGFSGDYDGAAHGVVSSSAVGVNSEALSGLVIDPATYTNVPGGTIPWTFTNANYADQNGNATVTINKAATVTTVSCGPGPFTYNGAAQTPCSASVTGPNSLNESLTVNYSDNTNAGTAGASASYAETANYLGSSDSENFSIGKATATITVTGFSGDYDGAAHGVVSSSAVGVNSEALSGLVIDPATYTNVPGGTIPWTFTNPNYADQNGNATVTINKAATITTVTCPTSVTYTGAALEPCSVTVTGAGGLSLTPPPVYANNTAAGVNTASASYSYPGDDNHSDSSDSKNFSIDKASSVTTVTCPTSVTYTGAALEPCSVTVTGAGGLSLTPAPVYANNTAAGVNTASASYTYTGDPNHNGSSDSKNFSIDKASSVTTVTCPTNVTYTGAALEPCSVTVTGAGGLSLTPAPVYANNTAAGVNTASASYTYTGDPNHNGSSDSKNFSIDKAGSTTTVTCTAGSVYTGSAVEPCTYTVTGNEAGTPVLVASTAVPSGNYTNNINAGINTAAASFTFGGDANHNGSNDTENFSIDKAESTTTVTCTAGSVYTGSAVQPCSYTVKGNEAGTPVLVASTAVPSGNYTNNINAGVNTASASFTYTGDANHNGSNDTENFSIDKAGSTTTVTCTAGSVYTGSAAQPCSYTVKGNEAGTPVLVASTPVPSGNYTNNINAGVNTASASFTYTGNANHNGSNDTENFSIDKAPTVITPDGNVDGVNNDCTNNIYTATLTDAVTGQHLGGINLKMTIGTQFTTANTNASEIATFALTLFQPPGTVTQRFELNQPWTDPNRYAPAFVSRNFTVLGDPIIGPGTDADSLYTGSLFFWTTSSTSSTATLTLSATIKDSFDACPTGDITKAKVSFYISTGGSFSPVSNAQNLPVGLVNPTEPNVGTASAISQYNIGTNQSVTLTVRVVVGGYYNYSASTYDQLITIGKPASVNSLMGGGKLKNDGVPYAASGYLGINSISSSFGSQVTYTKSGTNPKGQVTVAITSCNKIDGTVEPGCNAGTPGLQHHYWVKSNSISELSRINGSASFGAKTNGYEQLPDGTKVNFDSGNSIQLLFTPYNMPMPSGAYASAYGTAANPTNKCNNLGGCASVVLFRSAGGVWYSSSWGVAAGTATPRTVLKNILYGTVNVN